MNSTISMTLFHLFHADVLQVRQAISPSRKSMLIQMIFELHSTCPNRQSDSPSLLRFPKQRMGRNECFGNFRYQVSLLLPFSNSTSCTSWYIWSGTSNWGKNYWGPALIWLNSLMGNPFILLLRYWCWCNLKPGNAVYVVHEWKILLAIRIGRFPERLPAAFISSRSPRDHV